MRVVVGVLGLVGCSFGEATPLGVTLHDGQVVVGEVTTDALALDGVFGEISIPLEDVGVVLPVEAATLGASDHQVTVWLRNGSELRGRWRDPALSLGVSAGGDVVPVDVPTGEVQAIQLRGGEEWPEPGTYRVRTSHGDDVLVDPESTRITVSNALGTFSPFLSECAAVGPVGDPRGDWRVVLRSGTVLVGPLQEESLALRLPSGPDEVRVALADLVAIDQQVWTDRGDDLPNRMVQLVGGSVSSESAPPAPSPAVQGLSSGDGWFRNDRMSNAKR
jgi:hypothetical protein